MSVSLPGFDAWLTEQLEHRATELGENVDVYVAQAVAARMISDAERTDRAAAEVLTARVSQSGLSGETVSDGIASVLADARRLRALNVSGLMETSPDDTYARVTRTAADALAAPAAALVGVGADRQSVKSADGIDLASPPTHLTSLAESFDKYVVVNGSPVEVEDARRHPLFKKYSVVGDGRVVAYLGMPLADRAGNTVGALNVFDGVPRQWSRGHVQILNDLAGVVAARMFGA